MERSQAINQLNLVMIKCQVCNLQCPTYRIVRVKKQKESTIKCLNCIKNSKEDMAYAQDSYYETAMRWIDKLPTPDYFQAQSCLKLSEQIEKESIKNIENMKHKLEDIKWEIMQICKQTKLYCESYIEKVKYFENFNFSDLQKCLNSMHFDDGKLINQEAFFINLRQKRKVLNHLKGELSCLELKIPDIHELTVQKKEAKKEYSSRIPITAIINVKGRSYFGTAQGKIIYEGIDTNKMLQINAHSALVRSFSFDGQYTIFTGSDDFSIKAWDIHENQIRQIKKFGIIQDSKSYHRDIAVVNRGNMLVSTRGQFDQFKLRLWDIKKQYESVKCLNGHTNFIRGLVTVGQNSIITVSDDKTIKIWNIKEQKPIKSMKMNAKMSQILANQTDNLLMVADDENKVTILELKTLKIVGGWMMQRKVLCSAGSNTQVILATSNCIGFWRWNSEKFFNIDLQTVFTPALMMRVGQKLIVVDGMGVVNEFLLP